MKRIFVCFAGLMDTSDRYFYEYPSYRYSFATDGNHSVYEETPSESHQSLANENTASAQQQMYGGYQINVDPYSNQNRHSGYHQASSTAHAGRGKSQVDLTRRQMHRGYQRFYQNPYFQQNFGSSSYDQASNTAQGRSRNSYADFTGNYPRAGYPSSYQYPTSNTAFQRYPQYIHPGKLLPPSDGK